MTHAPVVWKDTPGDRLVYTANDTRKMEFSFYGYYEKTPVGLFTPPTTSLGAVAAAESDGANLRIDGVYTGPSVTYTPSLGVWVLSSLTVERLNETNENSDVVWVFRVGLELAEQPSTDEPYVELTSQAGSANVSAFRMAPTIPTDMTTPASDAYVASNDSIWHGVSDIGGRKVDWNGQPIQYALPILTTNMTIQRPAPIWEDGGTRDTGAIALVANASAYIGRRNSADVGFIGNTGYVLFAGISCSPLNKGIYNVTYTFRSHPWKHAIQVPRVLGSMFAEDVSSYNAERTHNEYIWWSQPHLAGANFLCDIGISAKEWEAVGITATCP
jgi:hypothetical protein